MAIKLELSSDNEQKLVIVSGLFNCGNFQVEITGPSGFVRTLGSFNEGVTRTIGAATFASALRAAGLEGRVSLVARAFTPTAVLGKSRSLKFDLDEHLPAERGRWSWTAPASVARLHPTATKLADGRVLVAGGMIAGATSPFVEIYDPKRGTWTDGPPMLHARARHHAVRTAEGGIVVVGGGSMAVERFDPIENTWSLLAPIPTVDASTISLLDGRLVVTFGRKAHVLDPEGRGWSPLPDLAEDHPEAAVAALPDGGVLVVGGATCERWDPSARGWVASAPLAHPRVGAHAVVLSDGRVLVAGGRHFAHQASVAGRAEIWDGTRWSAGGVCAPKHGGVAIPFGRGVLFAGGTASVSLKVETGSIHRGTDDWHYDQRTVDSEEVVLWSPDARAMQMAQLVPARNGLAAVALDARRVLAVGGCTDPRGILFSAPLP